MDEDMARIAQLELRAEATETALLMALRLLRGLNPEGPHLPE